MPCRLLRSFTLVRYIFGMPDVHLEVEKKYVADGDLALPSLTELLAGDHAGPAPVDAGSPLAEGKPERLRLRATYFDTADLSLAAAGLTLRRRTGGADAGWHLKVPAGSGARSEVRLPLGRGTRTVPEPLRAMVWMHSRGAELRPVAEIDTRRSVRRLVDATGQVLVELADDRVTARKLDSTDVEQRAGAAMSWREIEVELVDGRADLLDVVDVGLRARGLREATSTSKLAQVLDGQPQSRPASPEEARWTVRSAAGDVVLAHVREQVEQMQSQDLPVRLDAPDAVHKMRVATRRLRSALTTFATLFAADVVRPMRAELRWLAGELGAARDAEVMRDRVAAAVPDAGGTVDLRPAAEIADAELGEAYRRAHDRVLAELDGERYRALVASLDGLVASPPLTERAAARAGKVLPKLVARSYAGVARLVEDAAARPAGAEHEELLHDARKAAKQARYAGESVARVFGEDAIRFAEAMEEVQEALGEHQDSVLTRERLRELAERTSSTRAAFLYGRLHVLEESRGRQTEQRFEGAWKKAGRKSVHRWLR